MPDYHCYLLDATGAILARQDMSCDDDEAAIERARSVFPGHPFEVWQGDRKIHAEAATSTPSDQSFA